VTEEPKKRRFLTTERAAEELNQIRALLKTGKLRRSAAFALGALWLSGDICHLSSDARPKFSGRATAGSGDTKEQS
jgi:hypothetical protein